MPLSPRLKKIVDALPLKEGIRVLEIGCGTGAAAREVAARVGSGYVLGIDRSATAIEQAAKASQAEMKQGRLGFLQCKAEAFDLPEGTEAFDIAFAVRVGALDGRHPEIEALAIEKIFSALKKQGKLFIDGGYPLKEIIKPGR